MRPCLLRLRSNEDLNDLRKPSSFVAGRMGVLDLLVSRCLRASDIVLFDDSSADLR